jgi:RNA recognition motif-containing protein
MSDAARLKATIFVGGLDNAVNQQTLHAAFIPFGDIVDISLPKNEVPNSTDPHRGFGYVEFEQAEDAKEAIDNMDQSELYGRVIKVAPAKPQKDASEGLGSKKALWEQVGLHVLGLNILVLTLGRKAGLLRTKETRIKRRSREQ